jgi:hypothetical protein
MHTLWLLDRPGGLPFERANANSSAASAELLHDEQFANVHGKQSSRAESLNIYQSYVAVYRRGHLLCVLCLKIPQIARF